MFEAVQTLDDVVTRASGEIVGRSRAMASPILIRLPYRQHSGDATTETETETETESDDEAERLTDRVRQMLAGFHDFERVCTRFDPDSALSRINAAPSRWHRVPPVLFDAIRAARQAYRTTEGSFDPRVLEELLALGYDDSLRFGDDTTVEVRRAPRTFRSRGTWNPRLVRAFGAVHLRDDAIDLGGLGKGIAVGRCATELAQDRRDFLIDAGGDCYCAGQSAEGTKWRVGVEDAFGGPDPIAVLEVSDQAVATSSIRLRHWRVGESQVHHLIDPATRRPGGKGLKSVTVVAPDPVWAEVWAKVLFLSGRDRIAEKAHEQRLQALWIDDRGEVGASAALGATMIWRRT